MVKFWTIFFLFSGMLVQEPAVCNSKDNAQGLCSSTLEEKLSFFIYLGLYLLGVYDLDKISA